ncbi:Thiamine-monophosphate kinase [hydrothermal vent metagenome]|uniref:Thiamine-monophosphate kinase n=1 Tax=hydrothermal vent metagenome TaxID=652676 RepID=A0A3B0WZW8_9ZZZZ
MSEFDLINQFFKDSTLKRDDILLGIGDDCAILSPPPGKSLAVSTDTLISGVHFPKSTRAEDIGYKSLAVNLSDLAAMGAEPAWVSLAISLPDTDEVWLKDFMRGFNELSQKYNVALIGGDTTQGPLSITINITGFISEKLALKRSNANVGDAIFVTGTIGDAFIGLKAALDNNLKTGLSSRQLNYCLQRLNRPQPQIKAGQLLRAFNSAAIDISDGLYVDLKHICKASGVGACLALENVPLSTELLAFYNGKPDWQTIINAGDDYELCFTCPQHQVTEMTQVMKTHQIEATCIGKMVEKPGVECWNKTECLVVKSAGYNHFL